MEKILKELRTYHQMDIYTVNESWCIQLFDLDVCANDQVDCIYENSSENLIIALQDALEWAKRNITECD